MTTEVYKEELKDFQQQKTLTFHWTLWATAAESVNDND
jgi:hypothetical protein